MHKLHPTARPVGLWAELMRNHSSRGDVVYDPFLGSGTTLVVAEQLGRVCRGIELQPQYVDVAVRRWQQLTGKKAKRAKDGNAFDAIAAKAKK